MTSPDLAKCALDINEAIKAKKSVILACHCSISYSGRAESFLEFGDRMVIIKQDATLLVHQPTGSNPINYMRPESHNAVSLFQGVLTLKSTNIAVKEFMEIAIKKVYYCQVESLEDNKQIVIQGTEKDMSDMIFNNPALIEPGFRPLSQEEHTKHGFIDVFGYDKENIFTIIECKRYCADPKAVDQLNRYVRKMKEAKGVQRVRGILAAPKVSASAKKMLEDLHFEFRPISPPKYLERYQKDQKALNDF